jgi:uncharacterized protein Yka (UPF0111/DUF47 family)
VTPATTGTADIWEKLADPHAAAATIGNSENSLSVQASSSTKNDMLKVATAVQQIITELSEAESETDKIMVITKMLFNLMKQNGC